MEESWLWIRMSYEISRDVIMINDDLNINDLNGAVNPLVQTKFRKIMETNSNSIQVESHLDVHPRLLDVHRCTSIQSTMHIFDVHR